MLFMKEYIQQFSEKLKRDWEATIDSVSEAQDTEQIDNIRVQRILNIAQLLERSDKLIREHLIEVDRP